MSGRIFQNVVLQFKDTTDRTVGVIDAEGTVIACSELTGIGKKWAKYVEAIDSAEGGCIALADILTMPCSPPAMTAWAAPCAPWPAWP